MRPPRLSTRHAARLLFACVSLLACGPAAAQEPSIAIPPGIVLDGPPPPVPPAMVARDARNKVTARAFRVPGRYDFDGRLDEPFYREAQPITGFFQMEPKEGAPASEATDVWVMFDENNVYVSAKCWDSAPESQWVANEMRRNTAQLRQNDTFGVMFDTFYDRRNGYFFYTNPLGARADRYYTDETDSNADALPVWDVRTGRFDGGWTVEIVIPFKTLRYRPGRAQVWGMQLRRAIRRHNEWAFLSPVPLNAARSGSQGIFRISLAGTLVGLEAPPGRKNVDLKPYAISSLTTDKVSNPRRSNDVDADAGIDVRYGLTENLTADFTYRTDFAQVEVDEQQVNLTRFPLVFPEKREFFQEGRGIFDFGGSVGGPRASGGVSENVPDVFFSRRIGLQSGREVPIIGGARLTGEIGKVSVGLLNLQTDALALANASRIASTNFTAVRVKRDLLKRSRVGLIFTGRSVATSGTGDNEAIGADAAFSFFDNVNFSGNLVKTRTTDVRGKDLSYQARFSYDGDRYGATAEHLFVDDNFDPQVGFLRREDFRQSYGALRFSPRPKKSRRVRQYFWQTDLTYIENTAGALETRTRHAYFSTEFSSSDNIRVDFTNNHERLVRPFRVSGVTIPVGVYDFSDAKLTYLIGGQRRANGTLTAQVGHYYDGDIRSLGLTSGRVEILKRLSLEPTLTINWVDLPSGSFSARLLRSRVNYSFNPRMFVSALFQYNSSTRTVSTNARLRWEYKAGSELFVVYTDERDTIESAVPVVENRALVVKVNRLLRF
ncbi:MAG: DUF5916 domain-containing protein [Vicinamibacterales bacterium]